MPRSSRRALPLIIAAIVLVAAGLWIVQSFSGPAPSAAPMEHGDRPVEPAGVAIPGEPDSSASRTELSLDPLALPVGDGRARASLRVELQYSDGEPGTGLQLVIVPEELGRLAPSPRRLARQSDAEGVVECPSVPPGSYQIEVLHPSHFEHELLLAPGEDKLLQITFEAGILVNGEVLNRQGRPVADAAIWSRTDDLGHVAIARSDSAGQFQLREVQRYFGIGATHKAYAPSPVVMIQGEPGDTVSVRLVLQGIGGAVRGRVLSTRGEPVEAATVIFPNSRLPWTFLNGDPMERVTQVRVKTNSAGEFLAEGLPPLKIAIEARAEGHGAVEDQVEVYEAGVAEVTLRLTGTASIFGRVLDQQGDGLPGVRVHAASRLADSMRAVLSDATGAYRLEDLSPGEIGLQVMAGGKSQQEELTLEEGEERELDLIFASGLQLAGRLVDEQNLPLENWSIAAVSYRGGSDFASDETDQEGHFLLEHMKPGCVYRMNIMSPDDGIPPNLILDAIRPGREEMLIRVPADSLRRGSIRGRVLDAEGKPLKNIRMRVMHMQSEFPASVDLGDEGEFVASSLPAGKYWIFVSLGPQVRNLPDVDLGPGEDVDLGTIQAEVLGSLSLRFVSPPGLSPKALSIFDKDQRWIGGIDLVGGKLENYPMAPGSHFVQVKGEGISSRCLPVEIRPGELSIVELRLEAGVPCELSYSFADPNHAMARLLYLRLGAADGRIFSSERLVHRDGIFKLTTQLAPGVYSFLATTVTGTKAEGSFEIPAASESAVALSFELH